VVSDAPIAFALAGTTDLGQRVASALGVELGAIEERPFEDGEHKTRPLVNVRGRRVYVLHSLFADTHGSVNDKLVRMLFFIGALKQAGAAEVTAVAPLLCYARKDQQSQVRDPVTTRYVAQLFEAVGVDRVVTFDVHNLAAFQNAYRCNTVHLEATRLFAEFVLGAGDGDKLVVVSPDPGGIKRADRLRKRVAERLGRTVGMAFIEKYRSQGVVSGEALVGEVKDATALVVDDLIASGGTLVRAADACMHAGARAVRALATHGLFTGQADAALGASVNQQIVVTNTVPPFRVKSQATLAKLTVLDVAPLVAEAIKRIHTGGSIALLLNE
jgi:ribose-phosphate pyrophosphokinase